MDLFKKQLFMTPALLFFALIIVHGSGAFAAGTLYEDIPGEPKVDEKYIFYLHGGLIEERGLGATHRKHGKYEYFKIARALTARGHNVVAKARIKSVGNMTYAEKVANQIKRLIRHGLPAENITVVGHSKGAAIAMLISSILEEPKVNFVFMAGCAKKRSLFRGSFDRFLKKRGSWVEGRLLSLYDKSDTISGSCEDLLKRADSTEGAEFTFNTGRGHGLFYRPDNIWVDKVLDWAG